MTMYTFFHQILSMSLIGSITIIVILFVRFLLKRASKIYSYALWGIVFFRLLCPFSFSSNYSFFNLVDISNEEINHRTPVVEVLPELSSVNKEEIQENIQPIYAASEENKGYNQIQISNQNNDKALCILYFSGMFLFITKTVYDTLRLKKSLVSKVCISKNVYLCDDIDNSFVLGIIRPKIYLPSCLDEKEKNYILCHEKIHIQRFDPLIKALAMLALMLHWFNPLVWMRLFVLKRIWK